MAISREISRRRFVKDSATFVAGVAAAPAIIRSTVLAASGRPGANDRIGVGYVGANPLGAAVAAVIAASYLTGAWELFRYRAATASLRQAVADVSPEAGSLGEWLGRLHPSLRHAVRPRIEDGHLLLPDGPGWGTEVNEQAVRAHPPRRA